MSVRVRHRTTDLSISSMFVLSIVIWPRFCSGEAYYVMVTRVFTVALENYMANNPIRHRHSNRLQRSPALAI